MTMPVEPLAVVQIVETFVDKTLADAKQYENVTPLDDGNVFTLHIRAAEIYSLGFNDGAMSAATQAQNQRQRQRDRDRESTS